MGRGYRERDPERLREDAEETEGLRVRLRRRPRRSRELRRSRPLCRAPELQPREGKGREV